MKKTKIFLILVILLAAFLRFFNNRFSFSAVFGTLTVLLTYFLTQEIFKEKVVSYQLSVGEIASFLLAISPWHLHLSRYFWEPSLAVFLITLSAFVFQKFFSGKKRWLFLLCLLVFTWFFCLRGNLCTSLPIRELSRDYLSHFTPSFFFISSLTREESIVAETGLMYPAELPFLLMGLYVLFAKKIRNRQFLIAWFLLAPIPGCFYPEAPAIIRVVGFLPVLQILTSIGLISFWQGMKKKKSKKLLFTAYPAPILWCGVYCLLFTFNIVHFLHYYFSHLPKEGSEFWLPQI